VRTDVKVEAPELRLDPRIIENPIDWREVFGSAPARVEVEIGIGKGRFLLTLAQARPDVSLLGVDWANEFLRIGESRASKRGLANVRFIRVDARELVRAIPEASVSAYYIFYPDPWPKTRQQKRRFLNPSNAIELGRTLVPGGGLHVATDHPDYWQVIEGVLAGVRELERLPTFGGDEFPLPVDAPLTNFEEKYRVAGRERFRASWRRR
jgi:tRNA (guanine-N7-)-methyltransferase